MGTRNTPGLVLDLGIKDIGRDNAEPHKINYSGEVATSTADTTTFKILINSTLDTMDAEMVIIYTHNYYLGTPLPMYEYMYMLLSRFSEEIIDKYNLRATAVD
jgi:hypothetical protein